MSEELKKAWESLDKVEIAPSAHPPAPVGELSPLPEALLRRAKGFLGMAAKGTPYNGTSSARMAQKLIDDIDATLASARPPVPQEPVAWWNGIRKADPHDMTAPSFAESEDTWHDIPVYAGINPCNLATPVQPQPAPEAHSLSQVETDALNRALVKSVKFVDSSVDGQMALDARQPDETGWLIEHDGSDYPQGMRRQISWLYVDTAFEPQSRLPFLHTQDASTALRFAREEDAKDILKVWVRYMSRQSRAAYKVTQHEWPLPQSVQGDKP